MKKRRKPKTNSSKKAPRSTHPRHRMQDLAHQLGPIFVAGIVKGVLDWFMHHH